MRSREDWFAPVLSRGAILFALALLTAGGAGCSNEDGPASGDAGVGGGGGFGGSMDRGFAEVEAALREAISAHDTTIPFTLLLGTENGTFFEDSKGDSSSMTIYASASTSKWVTAAVILSFLARLELDTPASQAIDWWTDDAADPRSKVTLRHLLSFTSGLQSSTDHLCVLVGAGSFENCVENIYDAAGDGIATPGTEFAYGQNHMQVAGLMAVETLGFSDWSAIFTEWKSRTGLFPSGVYDVPSESKPLLAGGMHWTAVEYMEFLHQLFVGELLGADAREQMFTDHTPDETVQIVESPAAAGAGEAWHYGLGNWRECPLPAWDESCDALARVSSPGAYGAYPFIDFEDGYYGILARQGELGSFREGLAVYRELEPLIEELAGLAP
jgi:CubicO group peptidase (beta-lactamase class C family)